MTVCLGMCCLYHLYTNDSRAHLPAPAHQPLIGRQSFQRDRSPRVQTPGGDADLRAEAEFSSIRKLRRGVVHHDRAVDLRQETLGEIGRAHVCTPVTNAHLVCRLLLEKKTNK